MEHTDSERPAAPPNPEPIWCVVANVAAETRRGPGGWEIGRGTKHFPPGAKVYCSPSLWGDGYERIKVVGRHRGSHRYVAMVVRAAWLTNWRAQLVYSPRVIRTLTPRWRDRPLWDGSAEAKAWAEESVRALRARHGRAGTERADPVTAADADSVEE